MRAHTIHEQAYARLLRLYPQGFREEFGAAMTQHFRDQLYDTQRSQGIFPMMRFWAGIAGDTFVAAMPARMEQKRKSSIGAGFEEFKIMRVPSFRFLFAAFLLPLLAGVAMTVISQSRMYMAMARVMIERVGASADQTFDPYCLQTQFVIIQSSSVLEKVVDEMQLAKRFGDEQGGVKLKTAEAVEDLRRRIQVAQSRNTGLAEIRVFSEDSREAAAVANKIVDVYTRTPAASVKISKVDTADCPLRPVRPNIPLLMTMGSAMSLILAAVGALGLRFLVSWRRRVALTRTTIA
jgi:capsular polysaccharide biosynthesis protein